MGLYVAVSGLHEDGEISRVHENGGELSFIAQSTQPLLACLIRT